MTTPSDPGENLTSSAFDAVAFAYDETFGGWPAARFFRFRLIDSISRRVKHGSRLLDIGSGSGEDAVWLASLGYQVLGIDPSSGMVEVARAKAARAHVGAEFRPQAFETFISED